MFSHAEGRHYKFWGIFYAVACCFSNSEGRGVQKVSILRKRGAHKVLPCLEGGAQKWFGPAIFPSGSPPSP